eukprot:Pompholyxophrys_punicea_v1_NODE_79_length_3711_cov_11.301422.p3 type:complete len:144 gc:universal NODE_79_length_3711_cov_11.301422:982-1413(+)
MHSKNDFPAFAPECYSTSEGQVWLNSPARFLTFLLGLPGQTYFHLRNCGRFITEVTDGLKFRQTPFFWLKSFPHPNEPGQYLFLEDVVDVGESYLIFIQEFVREQESVFDFHSRICSGTRTSEVAKFFPTPFYLTGFFQKKIF